MNRRDFFGIAGGVAALSSAARVAGDETVERASAGAAADSSSWLDALASSTPLFLRPRPGKDAVFPLTPHSAAERRLDDLRDAGIGMVELYAPAEAGNSFLSLDTIDRYRIDHRIGTIDDIRWLIGAAKSRGLRIIIIDNIGYSSVEAVDFLKACDDVKAGRDSRETRFFCWADSADAPPPVAGRFDRYYMVRPTHLPGGTPGTMYDSKKHEFWQFSDRAGKFYWTKWAGVDLAGNKVRLPQFNWASEEFQQEAEKIVRFWMDMGVDGMLIDAVNWYIGYTWPIGRRRLTGVINSYGVKFTQPEGAGGFHEDPVPWITDGGWTCVQDYGLGIFWEKGSNVVANAIESGDPRPIERALRDYHDRVVDVGGVLDFSPPRFTDATKNRLATAITAAAGHIVSWAAVIDDLWSPVFPDAEESRLLKLKAAHPALFNLSRRQALPTAAPEKHYAFLRVSRDGRERILVVFNFQPEDQVVDVDMSGVDFTSATDLLGGERVSRELPTRVPVPAYGYRFFAIA
jgi:hypothetical protein